MKKLLLLAAAMLLMLPVQAHAYSITYGIDSVDAGLDYTASVTGGTLSVFINTVGATSDARIDGWYTITAGPGEEDALTAEYSHDLLAQWAGGEMTKAALAVSRPYAYYSGIATWDVDGNSSSSSYPVSLEANILYPFYALFSSDELGYGEASFSLTVPQSATPIPGAIWLLGTGFVGLAGLRRRMKANPA